MATPRLSYARLFSMPVKRETLRVGEKLTAKYARNLVEIEDDESDIPPYRVVYVGGGHNVSDSQQAQAREVEPDIQEKFRRLADQWRSETMFSSSSTDKLSHDAYLKIIGMGKPAIPLILRELEQRGGHWFLALMSITEEDPVRPEDAGKIKRMAEAWLQWGKRNNYL